MELIGLIAAIIGILTGLWFFADKLRGTIFKKDDNSFQIKELVLEKTPLFASKTILKLDMVNVLLGKNGTGKTALCEWMSVLDNVSNVKRWWEEAKYLPIIFTIKFSSPKKDDVRVQLDHDKVTFVQNNSIVPEPKFQCKFIFVKDIRFEWGNIDDLDALSKLLNYERKILREYLSRVGRSFYCTIQKIEPKINKDGNVDTYVSMNGAGPNTKFRMLSKSEQGRVVLEIAVAIAAFLSKNQPIILIVERSFSSLDKLCFQEYLNWMLGEKLNFQIIFNSVLESGDVDWSGCNIVKINGEKPSSFFVYAEST